MIRRAWIWLLAFLSLAVSGTGWLIGMIVGLFVVGVVTGYRRAWDISAVSLPNQIGADDE